MKRAELESFIMENITLRQIIRGSNIRIMRCSGIVIIGSGLL